MDGRVLYDVAIRVRAVELYGDGHGGQSIANLLGIPYEAVREWIRTYRSVGIEGLTAMGRKSRTYSFETKVGDVITIDSGDGTKHEVPILGFYEFWLTSHDDDATKQKGDFDTFSSVSGFVVFIYLVLATLMAVVVLLNLNVMFIDEKKREIIVLMINGFSVKDARHYVSYDNVVLTALGIIVGLVLGCIMGSVTVASVEPVTGVFVKSVDAWAVGIGILGSIVLSAIMSLIALRRVNRFKLTDINRF